MSNKLNFKGFEESKNQEIVSRQILQNLLSIFMSLLTALIVESKHIFSGLLFIFLRNILDQT